MNTTTPRPTTAERNGITITIIEYGQADYSSRWDVEIRDSAGGRCFRPPRRPADRDEARRIANAIWRTAATPDLTATEARDRTPR
jgi:hypothetical protein